MAETKKFDLSDPKLQAALRNVRNQREWHCMYDGTVLEHIGEHGVCGATIYYRCGKCNRIFEEIQRGPVSRPPNLRESAHDSESLAGLLGKP